MKLLFLILILFVDWVLSKLLWFPIEFTFFCFNHWFTLVRWAEEELNDY